MSQNRNDTTSGQRGPKLTVRKIPKEQAIGFIRRYHYSKIMPRLNKHYLGFYTGNRLAGVVALGWGNPAAPKHTEDVPPPQAPIRRLSGNREDVLSP